MEHVCSSKKDTLLDFHGILSSSNEETPLFMGFPSPFFDDISATDPILSFPNKPLNIPHASSESNEIKKKSVGKKDRHSKIHTAQGLRDRRMRLSLHIARKFFDLQDLLGFDKASETIDWLFVNSNEAIKEVIESFNPQLNHQSVSEEMDSLLSECTEARVENPKEEMKKRESRNRIQKSCLARETRDQARARARDRTRERLMIKEQLVGGNPKNEIYKLGLGYTANPKDQNVEELGYTANPSDNNVEELGYTSNPNDHSVEELGYTCSPYEPISQEASSPTLELDSSTHHLLQELQLANTNVDSFENYSGSAARYCSPLVNHNPPAGWLNSSNGFLGGSEWNYDSFLTESCNYEIVPITSPLTDYIYEHNPSSFSMSTTSNLLHFQSQNQTK